MLVFSKVKTKGVAKRGIILAMCGLTLWLPNLEHSELNSHLKRAINEFGILCSLSSFTTRMKIMVLSPHSANTCTGDIVSAAKPAQNLFISVVACRGVNRVVSDGHLP